MRKCGYGTGGEWRVVAADDTGVTVEMTGTDPDALADKVSPWAQQEQDQWPEMGLLYMLVAPGDGVSPVEDENEDVPDTPAPERTAHATRPA